MKERKKAGRKPIGKKALTDTEKKRRFRVRKSLRVKAAKVHGHTPVQVFIDDQHMEAFEELYQRWGGSRSGELNVVIFSALKKYFELADTERAKKEDWHSISASQLIEVDASRLFKQWEQL